MSAIVFSDFPELDQSNSFVAASGEIPNAFDAAKVAQSNTLYDPSATVIDTEVPAPTQTELTHTLVLIFAGVLDDDGNRADILTEEIIENIREYEDSLWLEYDEWERFCLKTNSTQEGCDPPNSLINFLYPGRGDTLSDIPATLDALPVELRDALLDNGYSENGKATALTTVFSFGYPFDEYTKPRNEKEKAEMDAAFHEWSRGLWRKLFEDRRDVTEEEFKFELLYLTTGSQTVGVLAHEFLDLTLKDALKAVGALTFVLVYMIFHTRSVLLSLMGVFHILLSMPMALFINTVILGVDVINFLQFLSIFIILGIGADDVFIMVDAWKQSALQTPEVSSTVAGRISWAVNRAAKAMAISSATTSAAFYVNGFSPIPAVAFFGIFTGSLVLMNYLLVITWYPASIVIITRMERHGCLGCCCMSRTKGKARAATKSSSEAMVKHDSVDPLAAPVSLGDDGKPQLRTLERFFRNKFSPFMYLNRVAVLAGYAVFIIISIILAIQLAPAEDPGRFLPDDVNLQAAIDIFAEAYPTTSLPVTGSFIWGVEGIDREGVDPFDPNFLGEVQYVDGFNPGTEAAQQHILDTCAALREQTWVRNTVTGTEGNFTLTPEVACFMEELHLAQGVPDGSYIPEADFPEALRNYTRDLTIANGGASEVTAGFVDTSVGSVYNTWVGYDIETKELRYVKVVANLTVDSGFLPASIVRPEYQAIQDWTEELGDSAPEELGAPFQTAPRWVQLATEEALLGVALSGAIYSLIATFVVMFIATRDFLVAFYVLISVAMTLVSLMAGMVLLGWGIGVIESISLTVTVGLAVDYVVHIGNSFHESNAPTRFMRLRQGLTEMGISVFSSAVTTLGSSLVLLTCTLVYFGRFGAFIAIVIALSFIYAFGFFFSLAAVAGPTSKTVFASPLPLDLTGDNRFPPGYVDDDYTINTTKADQAKQDAEAGAAYDPTTSPFDPVGDDDDEAVGKTDI